MLRWFSLLAAMATLAMAAGCAASAPQTGPGSPQYSEAVKRASAYCKKKGLWLRMETPPTPTRKAQAEPELQFRCVKSK